MKCISFIIPLYNAEKRLKKTFATLDAVEFPRGFKLSEIIFVDDGSRDKTFIKLSELSQGFKLAKISILSYKQKMGKKYAISQGLESSSSSINIVCNASLSNLYKELKKLTVKPKKRKRKTPLVSVIMPVYNSEKYLSQAIESIVTQTYKNFELIIINDASVDKTAQIIKTFKRRFRKKITVITTDKNLNRGGDMCANLGIERARGKYIARMDADDISAPTRFERQVEFLEHNKRVFLVGSNAYVINKNGKVIGEKLEPTSPSDIYKSYATFHPIIPSTIMLRRVSQGKSFSYQIEYKSNNDYYTFFKLLCRGVIFVNLSDKLAFLRHHNKEDVFADERKKFADTLRIRLSMLGKYNYKTKPQDIAINIAQAAVFFVLPQKTVKYFFKVTKILKTKRLDISLVERFITPSSA